VPDCAWETSFAPSGASQPIPDGKPTYHYQSTVSEQLKECANVAIVYPLGEILKGKSQESVVRRFQLEWLEFRQALNEDLF